MAARICLKKDAANGLDSSSQFDIVSKTVRDNFNYVEEQFGKSSSWEFKGSPWGSKEANEYEFDLKLEQISPITQQSFDEIKLKIKPYTDKILDKMKAVGIKYPVLKLIIWNTDGGSFKGSENLTTTFYLKK